MSKVVNVNVGERFGRLVILRKLETRSKDGYKLVECLCDCGRITTKASYRLKAGNTKSCGCLRGFEHGDAIAGKRAPEYHSWMAMKSRCLDKNSGVYALYGGRGIKVCDRWRTYINFKSDMGPKPEGTSLDRIDVNGDYEPDNCR